MIRGRMDIIRIITFFRWGGILLKMCDFSINIVEYNILEIIDYFIVIYIVILFQLRLILYYKMLGLHEFFFQE